MHSVLSKKNSKFRAVSSGMENCTTWHVCDSPVDLHTAATLHLEINQYEGSRVIGQVVCRWLFVPWPEFAARAVHMGCVINTVTLGQLLFNETNRRTRFQIYSCTKLYMFRVVPLPETCRVLYKN